MEKAILLTAILILVYGLFSRLADRSPITAPMVFVGVGMLFGPLGLGVFTITMKTEVVSVIAEITLILVLFVGATTIDVQSLLKKYKTPVRLLFVGLPLTMFLGAVIARQFFPGMNLWLIAMMAFILSPTDAALGQAVVESDDVPQATKESIAVESGLNDGIALPPILACISALSVSAGTQLDTGYWFKFALMQIIFAPFIGGAIGFFGGMLVDRASKRGWMNKTFQRLTSVSLAILAYAIAETLNGNGFIAAFFGGLLLGTRTPEVRKQIQAFGDTEGQQLMLFVFLIFGLALVPFAVTYWDISILFYAVLSLTVIRMMPVAISLIGLRMDWPTVGFIGWFGPRGIASVLYLLMVSNDLGVKGHEQMFSVIILTVLISVFVHGLSAVPLSKIYGRYAEQAKK
jgi:NhaP-type Na+/H+ or K+/H+ antiporter